MIFVVFLSRIRSAYYSQNTLGEGVLFPIVGFNFFLAITMFEVFLEWSNPTIKMWERVARIVGHMVAWTVVVFMWAALAYLGQVHGFSYYFAAMLEGSNSRK